MNMVTTGVIPAAGKGERFLPISKYLPKEMMPLGGKPVIQYAIDELVRVGVHEIYIIVSPDKQIIRNYIGSEAHTPWGSDVNIYYVTQPEPIGIADALIRPEPWIDNQSFYVVLPDDILWPGGVSLLLMAYHHLVYDKSILCTAQVPWKYAGKYGIVTKFPFNGTSYKILDVIEKPDPPSSNDAVIGRYLFSPRVFDHLKYAVRYTAEMYAFNDVLNRLARLGDLLAIDLPETYVSAGDLDAWKVAEQNIQLLIQLDKGEKE